MGNKTAIDWFIDNLPERFKNAIVNTCKEEIEQARAMHKEQIIEAAERFKGTDFAEKYYNETYNK